MTNRVLLARPVPPTIPISSPYGVLRTIDGITRVHHGVDFAAPVGTPVYAMAAGAVFAAGLENPANPSAGLGLRVWCKATIDGKTVSLWHGHLSRLDVKVGQLVKEGQVLGLSGNSGRSTAPHLHVQVKRDSDQAWLEPVFKETANV